MPSSPTYEEGSEEEENETVEDLPELLVPDFEAFDDLVSHNELLVKQIMEVADYQDEMKNEIKAGQDENEKEKGRLDFRLKELETLTKTEAKELEEKMEKQLRDLNVMLKRIDTTLAKTGVEAKELEELRELKRPGEKGSIIRSLSDNII